MLEGGGGNIIILARNQVKNLITRTREEDDESIRGGREREKPIWILTAHQTPPSEAHIIVLNPM